MSRIRGGWGADPLWGTVYDWMVEHPVAGGALWRAGMGGDLRRLYATADEIGRQPAGSRVLDVPCGGGVALRGLRPGQQVAYVAADISQRMLDRTAAAARGRGVDDQVSTSLADAAALPFGDGSFDLVVSLTGLHCFPDPHRAVLEMGRVLRPGGVLTGSAVLNDTGLRFEPLRRAGRASRLIGKSGSAGDVRRWLGEAGLAEVSVVTDGALGYFRGVRG
ncbi:MAG: class I SAM-dependent methyltransferase [Nocardioides sp.]